MNLKFIVIGIIFFVLNACNTPKNNSLIQNNYPDIHIVGAMKDVMWKGELQGKINIDTISNKKGLFGLGPKSYLIGEVLIIDGKSFVSRVTSDSTMTVKETYKAAAPFFVYANVVEWKEINVPTDIKDIVSIERFINEKSKNAKRPFTFKISGTVKSAKIHIQNLPSGMEVSTPEEAHQGQTDYQLKNEKVEIVGFFSTEHKGVFTHHGTYIHMHLINDERTKMGHLDEVEFDEFMLSLPLR